MPAFNFTAFPLSTYGGRRSLKLRAGALCRGGFGAVCPPNPKKLRNGHLIFNLRRAAVGRFCQILRVAFFSHSSGFVAARIFLRPLRIIGKRAGGDRVSRRNSPFRSRSCDWRFLRESWRCKVNGDCNRRAARGFSPENLSARVLARILARLNASRRGLARLLQGFWRRNLPFNPPDFLHAFCKRRAPAAFVAALLAKAR